MQSLGAALILGLVALSAGTIKAAALESCATGDSAICASTPNCHWDVDKRGCYPGPLQAPDACLAHGDKAICDSDVSLGCQWSADNKKCVSKAKAQ
jgi:hypothetical protein